MTSFHRMALSATAAVAGVLLAGSALAQWNGPWAPSGPFQAPGYQNPMAQGQQQTQGRRIDMTDHGRNMDELDKMFDGRLNFNRDRALRLARELEAEAGEALWKQFQPGSHSRNSRVMPRILSDFETFQAYAETLKHNAGALVAALENNPTPHDVMRGGAYVPRGSYNTPWRRSPYQRPDFGAVDMRALQAYATMAATCNICHTVYRGWR